MMLVEQYDLKCIKKTGDSEFRVGESQGNTTVLKYKSVFTVLKTG